jgi:hypothetical protein
MSRSSSHPSRLSMNPCPRCRGCSPCCRHIGRCLHRWQHSATQLVRMPPSRSCRCMYDRAPSVGPGDAAGYSDNKQPAIGAHINRIARKWFDKTCMTKANSAAIVTTRYCPPIPSVQPRIEYQRFSTVQRHGFRPWSEMLPLARFWPSFALCNSMMAIHLRIVFANFLVLNRMTRRRISLFNEVTLCKRLISCASSLR